MMRTLNLKDATVAALFGMTRVLEQGVQTPPWNFVIQKRQKEHMAAFELNPLPVAKFFLVR